ncbi:hypothetical protein [Rhabdothermincola salaria]|uniref:hypothetical protein n=1 Tax=Rhabdothermincola salaria TaxID=2903142 RepID=UPI001E3A8D88|nr:hypothetical protein [Rhabdothermincola salaria]MCD9623134.1 hypothetical protein [Rhabdothermincola salaria]
MEVTDGVDLYWIPLGAGAGGGLVRWSGRAYEAASAARARRPRRPLYHSALEIHVDGNSISVEVAPVWVTRGERGVVAEGAVGARVLGRSRLFRYEVRCWPGGTIPDLAAAVGGPVRVTQGPLRARRVVEAVRDAPALVWGRDELGAGDMWNSNSLVSWALVRAGVDVSGLRPPGDGRAPGWQAGLVAASTSSDR